LEGKIINITRFCTDDGPGIRTTVFLKGCPLKCAWCHNPESQRLEEDVYLSGRKIGKTVSTQEVVEEVLKDKGFYETSGGGVTVSGGEPLFQAEFTAEILRLCKKNEIHTAVETSGFAGEKALMSVLEHCDLVLFDIKETDEKNHFDFTGVPLKPIVENLRRIEKEKIPFIIRLPMVLGFNAREEHLIKVKELIGNMKYCRGVEIMPYHKLGEYKYEELGREYRCKGCEEPPKEEVEKWRNIFR